MGVVIRRRQTCLGVMESRIKTKFQDPQIRFKDKYYTYWMPEITSGKPYVRFKQTYQHPHKGKWGAEEVEGIRASNIAGLQAELASRWLVDRTRLNKLMTRRRS